VKSNKSEGKVQVGESRLWSKATIAGLMCLTVALYPTLINQAFYFIDDYQLQFAPMFIEVGRLLADGTFPLMTDRSWYGGAILAEYQYGVLNPISLLLYFAFNFGFWNLQTAATFFSLAHLFILSTGIFYFCAEFGCNRSEATVASITGCTSTWILYWCAADWIPGLVSLSWWPWALALLSRSAEGHRAIFPAAIFTALLLLSGWPFSDLALLIAAGIIALFSMRSRQNLSGTLRICVALTLGVGLAMPAIMPLWFFVQEGGRDLPLETQNAWRPALEGLLAFGFPSFLTVWRTFELRYEFLLSPPMLYAGWFLPLILLKTNWRRSLLDDRHGLSLFAMATAFFVLSLLPGFGNFRYPFRWIPYFHLSIIFLCFWAIGKERHLHGSIGLGSFLWFCATIICGFVLAIGNSPGLFILHGSFLLLLLGLTAALVFIIRKPDQYSNNQALGIFALGQLLIFMAMVNIWPTNDRVANWHLPASRAVYTQQPEYRQIRQLSLYNDIQPMSSDELWWTEVMSGGNVNLLFGTAALNGYSPIRPAHLDRALCFDYKGAACLDVSRRLFSRDPSTGASMAELFRLDRIVVTHGSHQEEFEKWKTSDWILTHDGKYSQSYERVRRDSEFPGSISWAEPGTHFKISSSTVRQETFDVTSSPNFAGGLVVFARAWYPGYNARLNGQSLPVLRHLGIFPEVRLPPGANGVLELEYWPAGFTMGLWMAGGAVGILTIIGIVGLPRYKRLIELSKVRFRGTVETLQIDASNFD
jgi:hypothetical protein